MPTPLQVGDVMMWDGSLWVNAAIGTAAQRFDVMLYGAKGDDTTNDTQAVQDAIDACAAAGGGVVFFPPGEYLLDSSSVASHQGTAITFASGQDNVTLRGSGRGCTILKPYSNKIEMFLVNGANNIAFEDLGFDNSANGTLQNQVKVSSNTPPRYGVAGGIAGYGNIANCAIRQVRGANLSVRRCDFFDFTMDVHYVGDIDNESTLSGIVHLDDCYHEGCCFGLLTEQPEEVYVTGRSRSSGVIASVNASSTDPGHQIYISNADGAHPRIVYIEQSYAENDHSSPVKIRKGEMVIFGSITAHDCGRGLELINAKRIAGGKVITRLSSSVTPADTQRNGLSLIDCGETEIDSVLVDCRGVDAYGVLLEADDDDEAYMNRDIRLRNVKIQHDYTGTTVRAPFIANGITNMALDDFELVHSGTTASTRWPIDLRSCTRAIIRFPRHRTPDFSSPNPSDANRLVQLDASCVNCEVEYRAEDIDQGFSSATINDAGSGTKFIRRDYSRVTADNGNNSRTIQAGVYDRVQIWATPFTADRSCALSTSGARNGDDFRIVRAASATGAFNLNVGTGPLKALAAGQWCDVAYNGSAWVLVGYGAL